MWFESLKNLLYIKLNPLNDYIGVNLIKREVPIIVSLSCDRGNFKNLPKTIYSIFNQNLKPDRVVLYLDNEYEDLLTLPYEITQYVKNGLEIKFVEYIGGYTKTLYAIKEYPNAVIVTADEQTFYEKSWLNNLYLSYVTHPEDINVNRTCTVRFKEEKLCLIETEDFLSSSYSNMILNSFGVLYPPRCFSNEVFRKDIFLQKSIDENAWLWIQALISDRKVRLIENSRAFGFISKIKNKTQKHDLYEKIELSLSKLLVYYKNNLISKLK